MILNLDRVTNHIVNWLKNYVQYHDKKLFIVEICPTDAATIATAIFCKKTKIPTVLVQDISLLDSEPIGLDISDVLKLPVLQINSLDYLDSIEDVYSNLPKEHQNLFSMSNHGGASSFYNRIVYSILEDLATKYNGLVVGTSTREMIWTRSKQKGCEGDILPVGDLYHSEIKPFLSAKLVEIIADFSSNLSCFNYCTNEELEWANRQDERHQIISNDDDPTNHRSWLSYSGPQRKMVAKLHHHEKRTRHKSDHAPICELRSLAGLVR